MPDPDIPPIIMTDERIAELQRSFPMMPSEYRELWKKLNLDKSVVETVLQHKPVAELLNATFGEGYSQTKEEIVNTTVSMLGFENYTILQHDKNVKKIFNWFASIPAEDLDISKVESGYVGPTRLTALAQMVSENKLSSNGGKDVFLALFDESIGMLMPEEIAKSKNLLQVSDEGAIAKIVDEVLNDPASAKAVADIKAGNDKAIGFLVGQIMKKSQGKANPALAQKLIRERL